MTKTLLFDARVRISLKIFATKPILFILKCIQAVSLPNFIKIDSEVCKRYVITRLKSYSNFRIHIGIR